MTSLTDKDIQAALVELKIRFDTSPKFYTKQDYMHLISCISQVYSTSNNFDIMDLLKDQGRIVNSTIPADENSPEGYSWLDKDNGRMVTYYKSGNSYYYPREGDHFLVLQDMTLYRVVKESGKTEIKENGELKKETWEEL